MEMSSFWVRWALNPMIIVLMGRRDTERRGRDWSHVAINIKDCWDPPEARKKQGRILP